MTIREARWPDDRDAALRFIDGLQRYEHEFEPNRRIDPEVAGEYFGVLMQTIADRGGIARIAEDAGRAVGWAVAWPEEDVLYVVPGERPYLYIAELFVEEGLRGGGVGRALIAACEDWGRAQGLNAARIGVMARNARAWKVYERAGFEPYAVRLVKRLD